MHSVALLEYQAYIHDRALPVLAQMSSQEVSAGPTPDRMAALAGHIIGQRKCAAKALPNPCFVLPYKLCSTLSVGFQKMCPNAKVRSVPVLAKHSATNGYLFISTGAPHSYAPLYPPPLGAMLDTSLGDHLSLPCTPDILVLPSDLAPFAKLVPVEGPSGDSATPDGAAASSSSLADAGTKGSVVCVNPGRLARDRSGGTYARLQVQWASTMILPA